MTRDVGLTRVKGGATIQVVIGKRREVVRINKVAVRLESAVFCPRVPCRGRCVFRSIEEVESAMEALGAVRRSLRVATKQSVVEGPGVVVRFVRCGKERCNVCGSGRGHGPYVYQRTMEEGKRKWTYIGKSTTGVSG